MHEMGMCQAVLEAVERRAAGRRVDRIGVRCGTALAVVPEVFEQGFQVLAQGGIAHGATADVEIVPGDDLVLTWLRYSSETAPAPPAPHAAGG